MQECINGLNDPFRSSFVENMRTYSLKESVIEELKSYADQVFVVVFTAEWCNNCTANVPVLVLLANESGLRVRVFSGLKRDILNPKVTWRIPPSPSEVRELGVEKIPHLSVIDMNGRELGWIIENPTPGMTLRKI